MIKRAILAIIILILVVILLKFENNTKLKPEIDFLDVGQGDSSLIKLPGGRVVIIDGGPDNLVLKRLGESLPYNKHQIDLVVLSHFHDDHIIGLIEILKRYQVASIIYMKGSKDSRLLELLLKTAKERGTKILALENRAEFNYGENCSIKILNPLVLGIKSDNNNSLITKLNCVSLSALFSGDNNNKVEESLIKTSENLSARVFKASHHGSKTANSEAFLRFVHPELLVISVGIDNRFGHPNKETLDSANKLKIRVKRTDLNGTTKISS